MNIKRQQLISIAIFAWAVFACTANCLKVIAQENDPYRRGETTLQLAIKNDNAKRVALERYRLWHRVQSKYGFPFYSNYEVTALLFPARRSDRLYIFLMNSYWTQNLSKSQEKRAKNLLEHVSASKNGPPYLLLCFQAAGHTEKLVYAVKVRGPDSSYTRADIRIRNLRDYIRSRGWSIDGKIGTKVAGDLTTEQTYVAYEYEVVIETLDVMTTDVTSDQMYPSSEKYAIYYDPITKAKLDVNSNEFYRKYGLPITKGEF